MTHDATVETSSNTAMTVRPKSSSLLGAWWGPAVWISATGVFAGTRASDIAGRETFFNVAQPWVVYVFLAGLVGLLTFGFVRHASLWMIGRPTDGILKEIPARLRNVGRYGAGQDKVRRDRYAGIMHWCISSSIIVLTVVTAQVALQDDTPLNFLHGNYYLFFSFYGDLFGLIGLIGVGMALYRRYFASHHRIRWDERVEDHLIIVGLGLILVSGFVVESARIIETELVQHPDWAKWSFVSWVLAQGIDSFGFSVSSPENPQSEILALHTWSWWVHVVLAFSWLGLIVFTRLDHLIFAPINAFFLRTDAPGRLAEIKDIEEQEVFGVGHVQDFTWKQLFELDACVRCGRCTEVCPANISGQP
ncbi:MAG: respiratory nitrate reductase subunit gamma, partial [Chloroflexota bacterium]|nr:respiratory nitrate reductase subunit gamma [Chloroflexota bacterium]